MIIDGLEYAICLRWHIVKPGELPSNNKDFICMISGYIEAENTKINDDVSIILKADRFGTRQECEKWIEEEAKTLNHWYLDISVRDYLKSVLSDENFQYLLDEEAKLLKEPKNA